MLENLVKSRQRIKIDSGTTNAIENRGISTTSDSVQSSDMTEKEAMSETAYDDDDDIIIYDLGDDPETGGETDLDNSADNTDDFNNINIVNADISNADISNADINNVDINNIDVNNDNINNVDVNEDSINNVNINNTDININNTDINHNNSDNSVPVMDSISNLFFMNNDNEGVMSNSIREEASSVADNSIEDPSQSSVTSYVELSGTDMVKTILPEEEKKSVNQLDSIFFGLSEYEDTHGEANDFTEEKQETVQITDTSDVLGDTDFNAFSEVNTQAGTEHDAGALKNADTDVLSEMNIATTPENNAELSDIEDLTEISLEQKIEGDSLSVKVMTFFLTLGLALFLVYLMHGTFVRQMIWSDFFHTTISVWMGMKVLVFVDAILLFVRYRKKNLLLSALLCSAWYLYLRRKIRQRPVKIVYAWIAVNLVFTIGMIGNFNRFMGKIQLYDRKYRTVMLQFELNKNKLQADGHCVDSVIGRHMQRYTYEVIGVDEKGLLEVRVAGDSHTAITDVVVPDHNISPNTELYFKVKRNGEYYITGLIINGSLYNAFTDTLWEYWCMMQ